MEIFFRCVMWIVRKHRSIPDHPRLVFLVCRIDKLLDGLHGFATDLQSIVAMSGALGHSMRKASVGVMSLPKLAGLQS